MNDKFLLNCIKSMKPISLAALCLTLGLPEVLSHASILCQAAYCSTPISAGTYYMGTKAVADTSVSVSVSRGGYSVANGSTYSPGELLNIGLSTSIKVEFVFEASNAAFISGYCGNKRIYTAGSVLAMPTDGSIVTIWAGWDDKKANPVRITSNFILVAPTVTPSPTFSPTLSSSRVPTNIPSIYPSNSTNFQPSIMPSERSGDSLSNITIISPSSKPSQFAWDATAPTMSASPTTPPSSLPTSVSPNVIASSKPTIRPNTFPSLPPSSAPTATDSTFTQLESKTSYAAEIYLNISGISASDFASYAEDTVRSLVASNLSIDMNRIIILPYQPTYAQRKLSIITSSSVACSLQLLGFTTLAGVASAKKSCISYLSSTFAAELSMQTGRTINAVIVTKSTITDTSQTFEHSCKLGDSVTLSWSVLDNNAGIKFQVINANPAHWLSAGIVRNSLVMVPPSGPPHSVYIYAPDSGMAGAYTMEGLDAESINVDDRQRIGTGITNLQSAFGVSLM